MICIHCEGWGCRRCEGTGRYPFPWLAYADSVTVSPEAKKWLDVVNRELDRLVKEQYAQAAPVPL